MLTICPGPRSAYAAVATAATNAAAEAPLLEYTKINAAMATSCTAINAVSPNVLNGKPERTLYARVMMKLAVSKK